jgi:hypothetical protein
MFKLDFKIVRIICSVSIIILLTNSGLLSQHIQSHQNDYYLITLIVFTDTLNIPVIKYKATLQDINGNTLDSTIADSNRVVLHTHTTGIDERKGETPTQFNLNQNYPNPFNPGTVIEYAIPTFEHVQIKIYDVTGREIAVLVDNNVEEGKHSVYWDAKNQSIASGVYYCQLITTSGSITKKMIFMKHSDGTLFTPVQSLSGISNDNNFVKINTDGWNVLVPYNILITSTDSTTPKILDKLFYVDITNDTALILTIPLRIGPPTIQSLDSIFAKEDVTPNVQKDLWSKIEWKDNLGNVVPDSLLKIVMADYDSSKMQFGILDNRYLVVRGMAPNANGVVQSGVKAVSPAGDTAYAPFYAIIGAMRDISGQVQDKDGNPVSAYIKAINELGDTVTTGTISSNLSKQRPRDDLASLPYLTTGNFALQIDPSLGDTLKGKLIGTDEFVTLAYVQGANDTSGLILKFPAPQNLRTLSGKLVDYENQPRKGIVMATSGTDTVRAYSDSLTGDFVLQIKKGTYTDLQGHIVNPNHPGGFLRVLPRIDGSNDTTGIVMDAVPDLADSVYIGRDTLSQFVKFINTDGSRLGYEGLKKNQLDSLNEVIASTWWQPGKFTPDEQRALRDFNIRFIDPHFKKASSKYLAPEDSTINSAILNKILWVKKSGWPGANVVTDNNNDGIIDIAKISLDNVFTLVGSDTIYNTAIVKEKLSTTVAPNEIQAGQDGLLIQAYQSAALANSQADRIMPADDFLIKIAEHYPALTSHSIILLPGQLEQK